ncbi:MAG: hypothetical protein K2W82_04480 [Candidatus Obscuribacterales bacterium]|nr:hypothetical protein [Candidatus Obscuribacterales bacterium]
MNINLFLRRYVRSVWQLELLLLLKKNEAAKTASELCRGLYMSETVVAAALENFVNDGLLRAVEGEPRSYIYAPISGKLRQALNDTENAYFTRKTAIINMIFATPIRTDVSDRQN